MKILTLTQPWASLVAIGAKRIETRSWSTDYRGQVAIHAAKTLNGIYRGAGENELAALISREPFAAALGYRFADELPRGAIVAVADVDLVTSTPLDEETLLDYDARELAFGNYGPGRYAWLLANVRQLPTPIEYRGLQGLSALDEGMARFIRKQLETEAVA